MSFISQRQLEAQYRHAEAANPIRGRTPQQVEQYLQANVNSLAEAKAALVVIGRILAVQQAQIELVRKMIGR